MVHVPPMGWTSAVNTDMPEHPVSVRMVGDNAVLCNGILSVTVNPLGEIVSCTDAAGRERIAGPSNVLRMYQDVPRAYEAWDIDSCYEYSPIELARDGSLAIVEESPFRCAVEIRRVIGQSTMIQRIVLDADACRVNFVMDMDWREQHRLLKACFDTGIQADDAYNEIQFGYVRRPTHRSRKFDGDRFEVCNHRYTALCDENRGAAVLNDCKYGVSMLGGNINLTLLRAAKSPDFHADMGHHHFTYSYCFWNGSFMESPVVREGYELNVPLKCAAGHVENDSLMTVDQPNIVIDTVKAAEDGSGDVIIRLYESKRADTEAVLRLNMPVAAASVCNLL